jgi:hypothetical protein
MSVKPVSAEVKYVASKWSRIIWSHCRPMWMPSPRPLGFDAVSVPFGAALKPFFFSPLPLVPAFAWNDAALLSILTRELSCGRELIFGCGSNQRRSRPTSKVIWILKNLLCGPLRPHSKYIFSPDPILHECRLWVPFKRFPSRVCGVGPRCESVLSAQDVSPCRWCAAYAADLRKRIFYEFRAHLPCIYQQITGHTLSQPSHHTRPTASTATRYRSVQNIAALSTAPAQVYTSYRAVPTFQITQNIDRENVAQVYQAAIVSPKVRCTLSLHQAIGNPLNYRHVATVRVDHSIRKGCPLLGASLYTNMV